MFSEGFLIECKEQCLRPVRKDVQLEVVVTVSGLGQDRAFGLAAIVGTTFLIWDPHEARRAPPTTH